MSEQARGTDAKTDIETVEYQAQSAADHRPCGLWHSCDAEYPALPSRWCQGCLIGAMLTIVAELKADDATHRANAVTLVARVQELEAEPTLRQLAVHLGWGTGGMRAEDVFKFVVERERLLRLVQAALDTHESDAPTAEAALLDRISVLRGRAEAAEAKVQELERERAAAHEAEYWKAVEREKRIAKLEREVAELKKLATDRATEVAKYEDMIDAIEPALGPASDDIIEAARRQVGLS